MVVGAAAHETNKSITDIASKKEALRKYENKADLISTALYKNCFYDYRITYGQWELFMNSFRIQV